MTAKAAEGAFEIAWIDSGREPQGAPDPRWPNGVEIVLAIVGPTCRVEVPYPARRCGQYLIRCRACGCNVLLSTAGRPDDPRSATIPCRREGKTQ